ncbi:transposase [Paludicola sp. MB14-C6]|uniref:REP-associated tyrosine transposase n=1 Tax=Paludihabitans sp. MB14-C6 TaxID=3070656 RepID=UPI0027DC74E2|nr:transposase [Paludicola sp. MB14-C6]WMJ23789.1 transposase [Paludicola sp. MB14-C6]
MDLPQRKRIRLVNYDYSQNNAYFITICTHNREMLFGSVGDDSISSRVIKEIFLRTIHQFSCVNSPKFVIMPNHFHAIIVIERADMESAPTLSDIIQSFKRYSTIEYIKLVKNGVLPSFENRIWQRSFHDHIIRNENEYQLIWNYIDTNPLTWQDDCFYINKAIH